LKLNQVKWVPGVLNPADAATRGISAAQLRMDKHWLNGPDFLRGPQTTWPDQPEPPSELISDLLPSRTEGMKVEKKKAEKVLLMETCLVALQPATDAFYEPLVTYITKFSRWKQLVRIIAICKRWKTKRRGLINPVEIEEAERALVYLSQRQTYRFTRVQLEMHGKVNHDNNLAPQAPFLDAHGAIRLGRRTEASHMAFNAKYPFLLHCKDPLTKMLATHTRQKLEHSSGPRGLLTEMNNKYWIPKATGFFRKLVSQCVPCRKRLAKRTTQIMAPLPLFRQPSARLHPFDVRR
jgi:hypothetical protein